MKGDVLARCQDTQLIDCCRTAEVERGDERPVSLAARQQGKLHGGRRLAGALQTDEHQDRRRLGRVTQAFRVATQQLDQLVADGLDHGLRRGQARRDLGSAEPAPYLLHELLDNLEVDVGLEQREPDLAKAGIYVLGPEDAPAADLLERGGEPLAQGFEHLGAALDARETALQAVELALQGFDRSAPSRSLGEQAQALLVALEGER